MKDQAGGAAGGRRSVGRRRGERAPRQPSRSRGGVGQEAGTPGADGDQPGLGRAVPVHRPIPVEFDCEGDVEFTAHVAVVDAGGEPRARRRDRPEARRGQGPRSVRARRRPDDRRQVRRAGLGRVQRRSDRRCRSCKSSSSKPKPTKSRRPPSPSRATTPAATTCKRDPAPSPSCSWPSVAGCAPRARPTSSPPSPNPRHRRRLDPIAHRRRPRRARPPRLRALPRPKGPRLRPRPPLAPPAQLRPPIRRRHAQRPPRHLDQPLLRRQPLLRTRQRALKP